MEEGGGVGGYGLSATLQLKDQLTAKIKSASTRLKELGSAAETAGKGVQNALNAKASSTLNNEINKVSNSLQRLTQAQERIKQGFKVPLRDLVLNVKDNVSGKLKGIKTQLESLSQKAWQIGITAKNNVSNKVSEIVNGAALGLGAQMLGTAGVAYSAIDAFKTYKDFEYQMATVQAITGADADQQRLLTARAKELGATTMFKASEVAKAQEYMGMAGWKTPQILAGLPAVLDLATASGEDLARVSDIVTDSMTAFGLKATDVVTIQTEQGAKVVKATDHFADVFAKLATNANTNVSMAGETAKYSAAVVGSLYSSQSVDDKMRAVEDWAQITGIMANAGIKGSMSGTAQRAMLTRLASMQMNANAARKSLGVDFVYQEDTVDKLTGEVHKKGQTRRLRDVINDIRSRFEGDFNPQHLLEMTERLSGKEFTKQQKVKLTEMIKNAKNGGMSDADKATLTSMLTGQEGMAAWLSVLMASKNDWELMAKNMDEANGAAEAMKNIKMDTLQGDIATLQSAWEALQLTMFEGKGSDGLRSFVQAVIDDLRLLNQAFQDGINISDIGSLIAKVVTQLKDKFLAFDGIGSYLAGGALIAGLKKIYDWTNKLKDAATRIRELYKLGGLNGQTAGTKDVNIPQSVNTMTVNANTVILNDKVPGTSTTTTTSTTSTTPSTGSKVIGSLKSNAPLIALTSLLSIADVVSTGTTNAERVSNVESEITRLQAEYETQKGYYTEAVNDPERQADAAKYKLLMDDLTGKITNQESKLKQTKEESAIHNNEALFGAIGGTLGSLAVAAIPGVGPLLSAALMIGGELGGSYLGKELSHNFEGDVLEKMTKNREKFNNNFSSVMQPNYQRVDNVLGTPKAVINKSTDKASISDFRRIQETSEKPVNDYSRNFQPSYQTNTMTAYPQPVINKSSDQPSTDQPVGVTNYTSNFQPTSQVATSTITTPKVDLTAFEEFKSQISTFFNELPTTITTQLTTITTSISTGFSETFSGVTQTFNDFTTSISATFSQVPTIVQSAFDQITITASTTWQMIQSEWQQIPAFFSGLWSEAAGAATSAGAAIASGINSAIGIIQSAWEGLSSWLSAKISALSSMASNAVSAVTSFVSGGISHNASGTANFEGGFTEINEHGGEIVYLPGGSVIYPHATTMRILKDEVRNGSLFDNQVISNSMSPLNSQSVTIGGVNDYQSINDYQSMSLSADLPVPSISEIQSLSDSRIVNNNNERGITINGGLNITEAKNIAELISELMNLLSESNDNYVDA